MNIVQTSYNTASTCEVEFAVKDLPAEYNANYFAKEPALLIEAYAGFPANPQNYTKESLENIITAQLDQVEYNPTKGVIRCWGRDLAAQFLDNKTTQTYQNQTASQVATLLANKRGLKPVITNTRTKIGSYLNNNYSSINRERTEWDLLCALAEKEGFIVYVRGKELHFEPVVKEDSQDFYLINYQSPNSTTGYHQLNAVDIQFQRNLTLAKDVEVTIRSGGTSGTVTAKVKRSVRGATKFSPRASIIGQTQRYQYDVPGLTKEQALELAQKRALQISKNEKRVRITLPADNLLTINTLIKVQGTNTEYDQVYYPQTIARTMSMSEGYSMIVDAKNHSPQDELVLQ